MIYVDRTGSSAIKLRLSEDGGRTFPDHTECTLHQSGLALQTREKQNVQDMWAEFQQLYSVGHADSKALPNGDLLVTFYTGPRADETSIAWVRVLSGHVFNRA